MLKNIPCIISPELLNELGHGDEFTVADANFPCYGVNDRVLRADGHSATELLAAIARLVPPDAYAEWNVAYMRHCECDEYPAITDEYTRILEKEEGENVKVVRLERFDFYEKAKKSRLDSFSARPPSGGNRHCR